MIEALEVEQEKIIEKINRGTIENEDLDRLYKLIAVNSMLKPKSNLGISGQYKKYIEARGEFLADGTEEQRARMLDALKNLITTTKSMVNTLWDNAICTEERQMLKSLKG